MRTDHLITALAADAMPSVPARSRVLPAAAGGAGVTLAVFLVLVGIRPDLAAALTNPCVLFKFAFAAVVAGVAARLCCAVVRPEAPRHPFAGLASCVALLAAGAAIELTATPTAHWAAAAMGTMPGACFATIVALGVPPTATVIVAMSRGAPRSPALAGGAAGLLGGAVGAAIFALRCPNDSVLFVAVWYVAALVVSGAAGGLLGRRLLAW